MTKTFPETEDNVFRGTLFLSASIPDPSRFDSQFDAFGITDAVVAVARTFLSAGWELVTAAHPTIAPLLLYVAAELPGHHRRQVTTYQSRLFEPVMPAATARFEAEGIGRFVWTAAAEGDNPRPGKWDASLKIMRHRMLAETSPDVGIFIGGMQGILVEHELFATMRPDRPRFAFGGPGGEAAKLAARASSSAFERSLRDGKVYPALARQALLQLHRDPD